MAALVLALVGPPWLMTQQPSVPWWNPSFNCRVKVTVNSGFYKRTDYLVRQPLDFAKAEDLREDSLRVIEWDPSRQSAREVPSKIGIGPAGVRALCWQMNGDAPTLTNRVFYLYFDSKPVTPPPDYPAFPDADKPPPGNLVLNPGFEEVDPDNPGLPKHWKRTGSGDAGEVTRTDEFAHCGKFSVKITNRKGGMTSVGLGQQVGGLKPGASYLVRGWVKITEQTDGGAGLTVWYTPAPGKSLPSNNKTQAGAGGVADWVQFFATGVIYHDAARGYSLTVDKTLPGTAGGWVEASCWYGRLTACFDDLELVERSREAFAPCFVTTGEVEKRSGTSNRPKP